jgi:hypothetical protein
VHALLALGASGCVLLVNPPSYGPHCAFKGASTPCGKCLATSCIEEVDACCLDGSCGGVITDVESCATKSDAHCAALQSATDAGGAHAALSACVVSHCKDVCTASLTDCMPAALGDVNACSCFSDNTPNATPCTSVGHPTLRCCAPTGWPAKALECDCLAVICVPIGGGCMCELSTMDYEHRATECPGGPGIHCCVDQTKASCTCSSNTCLATDTVVSKCDITPLECGSGTHQVDSCSLRGP